MVYFSGKLSHNFWIHKARIWDWREKHTWSVPDMKLSLFCSTSKKRLGDRGWEGVKCRRSCLPGKLWLFMKPLGFRYPILVRFLRLHFFKTRQKPSNDYMKLTIFLLWSAPDTCMSNFHILFLLFTYVIEFKNFRVERITEKVLQYLNLSLYAFAAVDGIRFCFIQVILEWDCCVTAG